MCLCVRHWENSKWIATWATNKRCLDWTEPLVDFEVERHHRWGRSTSLRDISSNYQDPPGRVCCHCKHNRRVILVSPTAVRYKPPPSNPTTPPCFPNNISSVRAPSDHWDVWLNKTKCCRCRCTVAPFIIRWANRLRRNSVCGSTLCGLPPGNAHRALKCPAHSACNWLRWAVTFWPKVNFTLT